MLRFFRPLRPVDALTIAFILLLALIGILSGKSGQLSALIVANLAAGAAIILIARAREPGRSRVLCAIHDWYPVPAIFLLFKEVHLIIQSLGAHDWDPLLIEIDRWIFGLDPTLWLQKISTPVLTEILQIAYVSYYFIMLAVGSEAPNFVAHSSRTATCWMPARKS